MSYSPTATTIYGATGDYAMAVGYQSIASGDYSTAMGNSWAKGDYSHAMGFTADAIFGVHSTAMAVSVQMHLEIIPQRWDIIQRL